MLNKFNKIISKNILEFLLVILLLNYIGAELHILIKVIGKYDLGTYLGTNRNLKEIQECYILAFSSRPERVYLIPMISAIVLFKVCFYIYSLFRREHTSKNKEEEI